MSVRIVSQEQIRFDIDVESYNRITRDVTAVVSERVSALVRQELTAEFLNRVVENTDFNAIAFRLAEIMDYRRIVEAAKTEIVAHLIDDERFKTLLQRGINIATVGVINETVEIVTSRIENKTTNQGDI